MSCIYAEDNTTDLEDIKIDAEDVSMNYRNGTRLNVELSDVGGNPVIDTNLTISINSQNYTRTTDDYGRASLAINLMPGHYLADIYFLGNSRFSPLNKSVNVNVFPTIDGDDLVKYYQNESQYYATFIDGTGDPLDFKNVTFNINGVFYTRTTDQNGLAKLNINLKAGDYILTAYNPNDGFQYSNKIKVLTTVNGSDLIKIYRDNHQYWVSVRDNKGNLLTNTDVEFNINGVFYTRKTNDYGNAKLNINLMEGKYVITSYNKITGEASSNNIEVIASSTTKLTSKNYLFTPTDDDTIKATLTNKLKYGVSGESIKLTVNNKTYTAITDDDGVASFYLNLTEGNYSLNFKHEANSLYGESSVNSTVETYDGVKVTFKCEDDVLLINDTYNVTLFDENAERFANQSVYFNINSNIYQAITDENGVASIKMNFPQDLYNIIVFYNQTGYKFSRGFSQIYLLKNGETTLNPLTSKVTYGVGDKLKVSLTAGSIALKGKNVKIEINGKNYTKTTDSNGIASLTINLATGTYNVNYYFEGDDDFWSCHASSVLTVNPRITTTLTVISGSTFHKNSGITYNIQLKGDEVLTGRQVTLTIASKTYTQSTDENGIANFDINDLNTGTYDATYSYSGDDIYSPYTASTKLVISSEIPFGYGYWVRYSDMYNLNLASLASQGTKHILLHSYAVTAYGENAVSSWIKQANNYGITVHLWMQVVYDGSWHALSNTDGSFNYDYINTKINQAKYYASISGVGGVHFDYLRYGGTAYKFPNAAASINYFVSQAVSAIKAINPNCLVSAAVMPEPNSMLYYDGQDIPTLSKYLDIIIPMVYKGNYGQNTAWIQSITQQFVSMSNGAQIWTGLQAYKSDSSVTKLSVAELSGDAQAALNGGAKGVIMFRWGVTNFINFNSLSI